MDEGERMAWDEAIGRATGPPSPHAVEVPPDVLIAVDAEFRPSSDARPVLRPAAMLIVGLVLGSAVTAVVLALMGAS